MDEEMGRVVLFGKTGSGQSTLANMLVGGKLEDRPLVPIGNQVRDTTSTCKTYVGRGWLVVDTMGFGEPWRRTVPDEDARKMVTTFLKEVKGRYSHIIFVQEAGRFDMVTEILWEAFRQIFAGGEKNFVVLLTKVEDPNWLDADIEKLFPECMQFLLVDFPGVDTEDPDMELTNAGTRQKELERLEVQMKEMFKASPWVEPDIFGMADEEIEEKANSILNRIFHVVDPPMAHPYSSTSGPSRNEPDSHLLAKSQARIIVNQTKLESTDLPSVRRLGKGLSGFIYETTWNGMKYARKDFPLRSAKHAIFEKEVSALLGLDHPNIVKCFNYTVGRSTCSLLLEYVDDDLQNTMHRRIEAHRKEVSTSTSNSRVLAAQDMKCLLLSKIKERGKYTMVDEGSSRSLGSWSTIPFEMEEAKGIISQIANGMKVLHDNQVIHGDLKPKNVLVCSESWMEVKVADFGLIETKKMIKLVPKRTQHFEILTWKAPERLEELLGPLTNDSDDPFTDSDTDEGASHVNDNFSFLAMADVYSFGLTCAHVLGGKVLFPNLSLTQLRKQRMCGFNPELPPSCLDHLKFIIRSCLQKEPSSRPTFSAICTLIALIPIFPGMVHSMKGKKQDLMALTTLTSTDSSTVELPAEIGNLTALETLNLDLCKNLEFLPSEIGNLTVLKTLKLSKCQLLRQLPCEIGNLTALETLDLDLCKKLEFLPSEIGNLTALKTLNLDDCEGLQFLPGEIGNLTALKTLKLSSCQQLKQLPSEIGRLTVLETLNLDDCVRLEFLPIEIGNLSALKALKLDSCLQLKQLPSEFGNFRALETLNLNRCLRLEFLPSEIGKVTALTTLRLSNCRKVKQLPSKIGMLTALETLNLDDCWELKQLPRQIGNLTALETLDLDYCESLQYLPSGIGNLTALKTLRFSNCCELQQIPSEIGNLTAFKTLNLENCKSLQSLPNEIGKLTALETLNLDNCESLRFLPRGIGKLIVLKTLRLSNCGQLKQLPSEIGNLTALETLSLDRCVRLEFLPSEIGNLTALKTLNLDDCESLQFLPSEIGNLTALETLRVSNCRQVVQLPSEIDNMKGLRVFGTIRPVSSKTISLGSSSGAAENLSGKSTTYEDETEEKGGGKKTLRAKLKSLLFK